MKLFLGFGKWSSIVAALALVVIFYCYGPTLREIQNRFQDEKSNGIRYVGPGTDDFQNAHPLLNKLLSASDPDEDARTASEADPPTEAIVPSAIDGNPVPQGAGNMHGNAAFRSIDDLKQFKSDYDQSNYANPAMSIGGFSSSLAAQVQHSLSLEDEYLNGGRMNFVNPGTYKIFGVVDDEGQSTTLKRDRTSGLWVCRSNSRTPFFRIQSGGDTCYIRIALASP